MGAGDDDQVTANICVVVDDGAEEPADDEQVQWEPPTGAVGDSGDHGSQGECQSNSDASTGGTMDRGNPPSSTSCSRR